MQLKRDETKLEKHCLDDYTLRLHFSRLFKYNRCLGFRLSYLYDEILPYKYYYGLGKLYVQKRVVL